MSTFKEGPIPAPPPGYELVYKGEYQEGDMFIAIASVSWRPAAHRIGSKIESFKCPAARPSATITHREKEWGEW